MIHPAARRRRQKRRMMAQPRNKEIQAKEITIKINLDKGTVSEETQKNQEGNQPENQGWTWWQQLIGVELLIGGFIVVWYMVSYFYQLGFKYFYNIPYYYMEFTVDRLMEPGKYISVTIFSFIFVLFLLFKCKNKLLYRSIYLGYLLGPTIIILNKLPLLIPDFNPWLIMTYLISAILIFIIGIYFDIKGFVKFSSLSDAVNLTSKSSRIIFTMLFILLLNVGAFFIGFNVQLIQEDYFTIETIEKIDGVKIKSKKVVLDKYKDYYVVAELEGGKKLYDNFQLVKIESNDNAPKFNISHNQVDFEESNEQDVVLKSEHLGLLSPYADFTIFNAFRDAANIEEKDLAKSSKATSEPLKIVNEKMAFELYNSEEYFDVLFKILYEYEPNKFITYKEYIVPGKEHIVGGNFDEYTFENGKLVLINESASKNGKLLVPNGNYKLYVECLSKKPCEAAGYLYSIEDHQNDSWTY
ncbi:hypothetical protein [Laceyella putida]|uniref:ABC transporter permease n=1 Tax=Laceyella putida TaxID=110101 RepID=A0ABW2RRB8_9BACL